MADVSDGSTKISVSINELFGTGIQSVEQTQTSEESGGTNEITVTLTNGVTSKFYVRNGMSGGTPVPVETADLMTETSNAYLYLGSEEGYDYGYVYVYMNDVWTKTDQYGAGFSPTATVTPNETGALISVTDKNGTTTAQIDNGQASDQQVADWLDNHPEATTTVQDGSITTAKLAPDVLSAISQDGSLSNEVKTALLNIFEHVAFIDQNGQTYFDALEAALYPPANLLRIGAVFNQADNIIYDNDSLDNLKQYLTVTAYYDDGTNSVINSYTLSGTLEEGTSTITVSYRGETATFNVTVTDSRCVPSDYTWLYEAKNGELLSAQDYVTMAVTGTATETLSDGELILNTAVRSDANSNFIKYSLADVTTEDATLSCRAKIVNTLESYNSPMGFRLQLSNGTNGAKAHFLDVGNTGYITVVYAEGSTNREVKTNKTTADYHVFELSLSNGHQKLLIDGDEIFDSTTLFGTTNNAIFNQAGNNTVNPNGVVTNIDWIAYYER